MFGAVQNAGGSIALAPARAIDKKEILQWEKEHLGLFVSEHPIREYLHHFPHSVSTLASLMTNSNGKNVTVGCLVGTTKKILTKKGEPMLFVQMEDMTGRAEALVFPRTLKTTEIVWREGTIAIIKGTVSDKDGSLKILCDDATKIA